MSKYLIEDTTLIGIADAIREKEDSTESIPVPNMATRIKAIESRQTIYSTNANSTGITANCSLVNSGTSSYKIEITFNIAATEIHGFVILINSFTGDGNKGLIASHDIHSTGKKGRIVVFSTDQSYWLSSNTVEVGDSYIKLSFTLIASPFELTTGNLTIDSSSMFGYTT